MAVGTITGNSKLKAGRSPLVRVFPVSLSGDWFILNSGLNVADNGGSNVLQVSALTRSAINVLEMRGDGTGLELCVRYIFGEAWTSLVAQMIGLDSGQLHEGAGTLDLIKSLPHPIYDADGEHDLTFSPAATTDKKYTDGVSIWALTAPQSVDCRGASWVVPAVKTAVTGAGAANCVLLGRLI
jgi:hypothetical protein